MKYLKTVFESERAKFSTATWDGTWSQEEFTVADFLEKNLNLI